MAFLHRGIGDNDSEVRSATLPREILGAVRWVAIPCTVVFFASWSAAALASLHAATYRASGASFLATSQPFQQAPQPARQSAKAAVPRATDAPTAARLTPAPRAAAPEPPAAGTVADPFGKVVARAGLSRARLLAAFADAGMAVAEPPAPESVRLAAAPIAARFRASDAGAAPAALVAELAGPSAADDSLAHLMLGHAGVTGELTYAAVEQGPENPVQLAMASLGGDPLGMAAEAGAPDSVELPPEKPNLKPGRADAKPEAGARRKQVDTAEKPALPARLPGRSDRQESQALAYARPDNPAGGAFGKLFNAPKAGDRVAVYDISAAVVHMPDGSKLEAHSGIGRMADDPRYVHVKMNGPTPPNTYRLTMREKRFHGVEAVRMTPVGEQTMHGRDGILAHSYLLRGGRAESHGCVAFKDYARFLKAFKQGKVTHMVVVPSMSKLPKVRLASMGRGT